MGVDESAGNDMRKHYYRKLPEGKTRIQVIETIESDKHDPNGAYWANIYRMSRHLLDINVPAEQRAAILEEYENETLMDAAKAFQQIAILHQEERIER